ncbi:hypothetical protein MEI_00054 [Bartonella vinsonii subsp. arupensis Pm136co]|uniref:Uncharacterized protein n=1 Tax=Bartonella vinsonii subsp. arupensis Pm136co TaxID=1094561 RepID=A0ABP2QVF0_BARVI|nr:hypothetical protein [Bartonella vinsonii]EJF98887.1 hypothetical protein MEI_00054 [Bartonella vinsonii subsp. arupensis Pm136co]
MNLKYFITAFTTFASISVAQGTNLMMAQKLKQSMSSVIPSVDSFTIQQASNSLSEIIQTNFSCIENNQGREAVELVPVASSSKRRGHRGKRGRPNLFKGPMSF